MSKSRIRKDGKAPLFCRLTFLSKRKQFATGFFIDPKQWHSKKQILNPSNKDTLSKNENNPNIDPSILQAAIKNAKANLSAYKGKLKSGQGTVASNLKGVKRWKKRLQELEDMLPDKIPDKNEDIIPEKGSDNGVATLF